MSASLSRNFDFTSLTPRCDNVAKTLVPEAFVKDYIPLTSTGNGNCLFNSISLLLCGSEKLANELRLRTVLELAGNFNFYADHPLIRNTEIKSMSKRATLFSTKSIYDTVIFSNQSHDEYAVKKEIMLTARNYLQVCCRSCVLQV